MTACTGSSAFHLEHFSACCTFYSIHVFGRHHADCSDIEASLFILI